MKRTATRNENDRIMEDFANLGISEIVLLGRYHYSQAHSPLKPHAHHDIIEICLLERGAQTYIVGPTRYDLAGGDVFITQPGEVHGTGHEPEGRGRLYWLEFKVLKNGQSFLGLTPQESQTLLQRFLSLPTRHFRKGDMLAPTFERVLAACADRHNPLQKADVSNLLLRLVLDIIAVAERQVAKPYSPGIQNAIRFIEQDPERWPTLAQLARVAAMSESHFKLTFKKETGMPPIEYGMWRRIEKAKHLLRSTTQPITRISVELGFSTSQHFATVFKRLTSLTPKAFRNHSHQHIQDASPAIGAGPGFHPR